MPQPITDKCQPNLDYPSHGMFFPVFLALSHHMDDIKKIVSSSLTKPLEELETDYMKRKNP